MVTVDVLLGDRLALVAIWPEPSSVAGRRARNGRIAVCTITRPIEAANPTASANRASAARACSVAGRMLAVALPRQDDRGAGRTGVGAARTTASRAALPTASGRACQSFPATGLSSRCGSRVG